MDARQSLGTADQPYTGHQQQDSDQEFGIRQAQFKNAGVLDAARLGSVHAQPFRRPRFEIG